jgi:excisionase family DNA binding protein
LNTDAIIAEIRKLPRAALPGLLIAIGGMMAEPASDHEPLAVEPDDVNLTLGEAAKLMRRSTKWIYRHMANGGLPFVRKLGPRSYVVSKNGLERWLARRPC